MSIIDCVASNAAIAAGLAFVAAIVGRLAAKPQVRHALWLLVLVKLVTPPVVRIPVDCLHLGLTSMLTSTGSADANVRPLAAIHDEPIDPVEELRGQVPMPSPSLTPNAASIARNNVIRTQFSPPVFVPKLLGAVWVAGSAGWFFLALRRLFRLKVLLQCAEPASGQIQADVRAIAAIYGLGNIPRLLVAEAKVPPLIWSLGGRTIMLLPGDLIRRLGADERAGLLAHELAHVRRLDHWIRWFEFLVLGIYWWNPIAWWARAQVQQAEEECCDAWVLWAFPDRAPLYAQTLVDTVEFLSGSSEPKVDTVTAFSQGHRLQRRVEMIINKSVSRRLSWKTRAALVLIALIVAPISLFAEGQRALRDADSTTVSRSPNQHDRRRQEGSKSTAQSDADRNSRQTTIQGRILQPDGKPALGARVIIPETANISLAQFDGEEFPMIHRCASAETDSEGRFVLPLPDSSTMIIVAHKEGSARTSLKELAVSGRITLKPWAALEGILKVGAAPGADERISVKYERPRDQDAYWIDLDYGGVIRTDADGRFECHKLMPGLVKVARMVPIGENRFGPAMMMVVELLPGKTTKITLGGSGHPVVGRMALPAGYQGPVDMTGGSGVLLVGIPPEDFPDGYDRMTSRQKRAFLAAWWNSPQAREAQRKRGQYSFKAHADGSFRVEDVSPGWYTMYLSIKETRTMAGVKDSVELASASHKFAVPGMPDNPGSEPLDVGAIELTVYRRLKVGQEAPDFSAQTADGKPISLDGYRGKYLLLYFWDTGGPNNIMAPLLRKIAAWYADDQRLALVGLNADQFTDVAVAYAKEKNFAGIQGYLGRKSNVQSAYGADEAPTTFLIDPDGKILAEWIQDGRLLGIEATLQRILPSTK